MSKRKSLKRVAILTTFISADPAFSLNRIVQDQILMLLKHGYHPKVFVRKSDVWNCPPENYGLEGVQVIQLPFITLSEDYLNDPTFDQEVTQVIDVFESELADIDVVLTHDIVYLRDGLKLAVAAREFSEHHPDVRWFHWIHSATSPQRLHADGVIQDAHLNFLQKGWHNSKMVFFNHLSTQRIAKNFNVFEHDVEIVPHPTDVCRFLGLSPLSTRLYEEKKLYDADFISVIPSRLDRGKQLEWPVAILGALKARGYNVRLVFMDFHSSAGDKLSYRKELKSLGNNWELGESELTFLSEFDPDTSEQAPHSMVSELFRLANVMIVASRTESYSLVAQEAALSGSLLILNQDFPPMRDIFGHNALYFQFSSNINSITHLDGDTETAYQDYSSRGKPDFLPDSLITREPEGYRVSGNVAYAQHIALAIEREFQKNKPLAQQQVRLKNRNLFSVFRMFLQPLIESS